MQGMLDRWNADFHTEHGLVISRGNSEFLLLITIILLFDQ